MQKILRQALSLACLTLLTAGCEKPAPAPPAPAAREAAAPPTAPVGTPAEAGLPAGYDDFPTFGLAIKPPPGWRRDPAMAPAGFVGRWLPENDADDDWSQFAIDLQPSRGKSLRGAADLFTRQGYALEEFQLDGFPAVRLTKPSVPKDANPELVERHRSMPSPVVACARGGSIYRILFLLDGPQELPLATATIQSWRWRDTARAVDHLELGDPVAVLDNVGTLRIPKAARRDLTMQGPGSDGIVVFDYRAEQDAILMALEVADPENGDTLQLQTQRYSEQVESHTRLNAMIRFAPEPKSKLEHVWVSDPLEMSFQTEDGRDVKRLSLYAVWRPHADKFVRMQFVINNEVISEPEDIEKAVEAIRAIVQSCSVERENKGAEEPHAPSE
ncbi:hypothetical protein Pla175_15540 [Pirellulimonas nuda]|uniref:Uncharacterized protein n=1 Tax=Pirellulimonas nuda TaxID=2528009 RepID=A0A518D9L5_9BACT|nr:hypothetical protein [Pirellulimonas nuda]QDU88182.1 hypothetical protein Pla175_15540 [Pirellulimonas nuda]